MSSIKLISKNGDFLSLLKRMEESGHTVQTYIDTEKPIYEGMLNKVHDIAELDISDGDMVLFDMVGFGKGAEVLKEKGYYVVGGGILNDRLELEREFGLQFMIDNQVPIPPSLQTDRIDEAREIIRETGKRYVFKPSGNLSTDLTYVSTGPENLLDMLDYLEDKIPEDCTFVLQEFVEGVEMSTEAWFNGNQFILPLNSTFEEKKFMSGNLGPNTGCSGNVVVWWDDHYSQIIYDLLFKNIEDSLREGGYVGPFDINAIWTPQGPMVLEFTTRFGYDAIQCSSRQIDMELGDFLSSLPELTDVPLKDSTYSMGVRVSVPPYPNDGEIPQFPLNFSRADQDMLYLSDVQLKDGKYRCAGEDGYVVCVAQDGKSLGQVARKIYSEIDKLEIPQMQYRMDIGERVEADRRAVITICDRLTRGDT